MNPPLTDTQLALIRLLQEEFPLCERPFDVLGGALGLSGRAGSNGLRLRCITVASVTPSIPCWSGTFLRIAFPMQQPRSRSFLRLRIVTSAAAGLNLITTSIPWCMNAQRLVF